MQGAVGCDGESTTIEDLLADTDYISPVDLVMDVEKILKPQEHTVILGYYFDRKTLDDIASSVGEPYHPQTQGKIERWHQTLKNRILLEHYYLPGDLERQVAAFVAHYNHARYHES